VVLLHNPEQSLIDLPTTRAYNRLSAACAALAEAKAAGLCGEWGISSWSPRPVLEALAQATPATVPRPDVVMVRVGLLVRADVLDEADCRGRRPVSSTGDGYGRAPGRVTMAW
jgi:pyridoxine 4-dehydrogenase